MNKSIHYLLCLVSVWLMCRLPALAGTETGDPNKVLATVPSSDCRNAIPICGPSYTHTPGAADDYGFVQDLPAAGCPTSCNGAQEQRSTWFVVTVKTGGTLGFNLVTSHNYDWAMYDAGIYSCADIQNGTATPIRCNASSVAGNTGLYVPTGVPPVTICSGPTSAPYDTGFYAVDGQTFYLVVNSATASAAPYTINFLGDAVVGTDTDAPTITGSFVDCSLNRIRLSFSELILCSSINVANFSITTNPGGWSIASVQGADGSCGANSYTKTVDVFLNPGAGSGSITVQVAGIQDKCNNLMVPAPVTLDVVGNFTLNAVPTAFCAGGTATVNGPAMPAGYTYLWNTGATTQNITVSPIDTTTYTLTVTAPGSGCFRAVSTTVNVIELPVVSMSPPSQSICSGNGTITATATGCDGDCNFAWTALSGGPVSAPATVTGVNLSTKSLPPGVYQVIVSRAGCNSAPVTATITQAVANPTAPVCDVIYVSPAGAGSGVTKNSPTNIQNALTAATCRNVIIKMQVGDYFINAPLNINSFVTLEGGYNATFTEKTSGKAIAGGFPLQGTRIVRRAAHEPGSGVDPGSDPVGGTAPRVTAINVNGSSQGFRLQDLIIRVNDALAGSRVTNYGIYIGNNSSNYHIVRCVVDAGKGGDGQNGLPGKHWDGSIALSAVSPGPRAADGSCGGEAGPNTVGADCPTPDRIGGAGGGVPGAPRSGGKGGDGGVSNTSCNNGQNGEQGRDHTGALGGTSGINTTPGSSGAGGNCGNSPSNGACDNPGGCASNGCGTGMRGKDGVAGADGADGITTNGSPVSYAGGYFIPGSNGLDGTLGTDGMGGGGGGGGGNDRTIFFGDDPGAGGGGGGQGGLRAQEGGKGAVAGGGAFAIFRVNSLTGSNITDCILNATAGIGGTGGLGGRGQEGGIGGVGGDWCDGGAGGNGGNGGRGGHAGNGGNAAAGVAAKLADLSALNVFSVAPFTDFTALNTTQPVIRVENITCTQKDLVYTNNPGVTTWNNLGTGLAGSTPALGGSAATITANYSVGAFGRKSVQTTSGGTYTDFHAILIDPPPVGDITPAAPVVGCHPLTRNFQSTAASTPGNTFQWSVINPIGGGSVIAQPDSAYTDITFNNTTAGDLVFTVRVDVTSECCGYLGFVTRDVTVKPIPPAPTIANTTVCPGGTVTLTPTAPAGVNFKWYTSAGVFITTGSSFTTPALTTTTTYQVSSLSVFGCESPKTNVTVTVTPTPAPTATGAVRCDPGTLVLTVNQVPNAVAYVWYDVPVGGVALQNSPNNTFTTPVIATTTTYYVAVILPGCAESARTPVQAQINPVPPAAPVATAASAINCTGFTANWNIVPNALSYRLDVATDAGFTSLVPGYNDLTVTGISWPVTGLTTGTTYYYRLRAFNNCGTSANSNVINVTTLTLPAAAPVAIAATNVSCTGFEANWNAVTGATDYKLDVATDAGFTTFVPGYNNLNVAGLTQNVTGLAGGTTYYYRVRASNACGVFATNSNTITVTTGATPPAPVAIAATLVGCTGFTANWNAVPGVTSYTLDVATDAGFATPITGSPFVGIVSTSQAITGLTNGTTYYYRVRAVDVCGTSVNSNTITVTTENIPGVPTGLNASGVSCTGFTANWTAATGTVTSYTLEVSTDAAHTLPVTGSPFTVAHPVVSANITGLSVGTTYYFRVRATNVCGNSAFTLNQTVTTSDVPVRPDATVATAVGCTGFTANWLSVAGATDYLLDVSTGSTFGTFLPGYSNRSVGVVLSEPLTGLVPGTTYYYRIRALNVCGNSDYSDTISVTLLDVPPAPVELPGTAIGCTEFTANWNAVGGATGYRLDVSTDPGFGVGTFVGVYNDFALTGTTQTITGLSTNTAYYYRVRAVNSCGTSLNSGIINVNTADVPGVPNIGGATGETCNSFIANWFAAPNATSYELQVATDVGFTAIVPGYNNLSLTTLSHSVTGLTPGVTYYYRVRAVNSCAASAYSALVANATTLPTPPAPVSLAAVDVGCSNFRAIWESVASATGYRLDVATDAGFTGFVPGFNDLAVLAIDTSVNLTGLVQGVTYYYRVRAENVCGSSSNSVVQSVFLAATGAPDAPTPVDTIRSCVGGSYTIIPTSGVTGATYLWYPDAVISTPFYTGDQLTVGPLTGNYSVWVATVANGCTSITRTEYTITAGFTIEPPVVPPVQILCGEGRAFLRASVPSGTTALWFSDRNSSTPFWQGNTYITSHLRADSIFWVATTANGCTSALRTSVLVDVGVQPPPAAVNANTIRICAGQKAIINIINPANQAEYLWFSGKNEPTAIFRGQRYETQPLFENTEYYVATYIAGCTTAFRTRVVVEVTRLSENISFLLPQNICNGNSGTITINNPDSAAVYEWYSSETGTNPIWRGTQYRTPALESSVTYWVSVISQGCTTLKRIPVFLQVIDNPVQPSVAFDAVVCKGDSANLRILSPDPAATYYWYSDSVGGTLLGKGIGLTQYVDRNFSIWVVTEKGPCASYRKRLDIEYRNTPPPMVEKPNVICVGGDAVLRARATRGTVYWYADTTESGALAVRDTLLLQQLRASTTVYARADDGICASYFVPVEVRVEQSVRSAEIKAPTEIGLSQLYTIEAMNPQPDVKYIWDFGLGSQPRYAEGAGPHRVAHNLLGINTVRLISRVDNCESFTEAKVLVKAATGIEAEIFEGLKIYPNPAKGACTIVLPENAVEAAVIRLYDVSGKQIQRQTVAKNATNGSVVLDLSGVAAGVYNLRIQIGTAVATQRLIVE